MIRGASGKYRGVKYQVLDERKKGAGIEAEVEVETKKCGERGIAVLEMMGPNNRKEFGTCVCLHFPSQLSSPLKSRKHTCFKRISKQNRCTNG